MANQPRMRKTEVVALRAALTAGRKEKAAASPPPWRRYRSQNRKDKARRLVTALTYMKARVVMDSSSPGSAGGNGFGEEGADAGQAFARPGLQAHPAALQARQAARHAG